MEFPVFCVLLSIVFLPIYAFPADIVLINTTLALTNTNEQAPENSRYHCSSQLLPGSFVNSYLCGLSIQKLPNNDDTGEFHAGLRSDEFQLPREGKAERTPGVYVNCMVRVKIRDRAGAGAVEKSTWREIVTAAQTLNRACIVGDRSLPYPVTRTGWTTVGENERIKVRLLKAYPNGTVQEDDDEDDEGDGSVTLD